MAYGTRISRGEKPPKSHARPTIDAESDFNCILDVNVGIDDVGAVGADDPMGDGDAHAEGPAAEPEGGERSNDETVDSPEKHERDRTTALEFVNIPSLAANIQAFRMKLTPCINFMHKSLDMGGAHDGRGYITRRLLSNSHANIEAGMRPRAS